MIILELTFFSLSFFSHVLHKPLKTYNSRSCHIFLCTADMSVNRVAAVNVFDRSP